MVRVVNTTHNAQSTIKRLSDVYGISLRLGTPCYFPIKLLYLSLSSDTGSPKRNKNWF